MDDEIEGVVEIIHPEPKDPEEYGEWLRRRAWERFWAEDAGKHAAANHGYQGMA